MIPTDVISHIGNYIKYHKFQLLNREINEKITSIQSSEQWYNIYSQYFTINNIRITKLEYMFTNWKDEYLRISNYKSFDLFRNYDLTEFGNLWKPAKSVCTSIECIPKELGNMIYLEEIYLHNNMIVDIPKEFENLIRLQILYLNNNMIRCISFVLHSS